jgi:heme/copper-type cytochrome/quinol oxidase subunit 2
LQSIPVSQDLFAFVVVAIVFVSGMAGLAFHAWHPSDTEQVSETRDLINRLTGLVAAMSALVLGLLVASANSFYNTQKASLEWCRLESWNSTACYAAVVPTPNRLATC